MSLEPPPPSEIEPSLPKAVDAVIARALAKNPDSRYGDAEGFVKDLRAALETVQTTEVPRRSSLVWMARA